MAPKSDINTYFLNAKSYMLEHFPRKVTRDNYKEICEKYFVHIGITEQLDESLLRISKKLNFEYVGDSIHVNRTE